MPELPEVESVRIGVASHVAGRAIVRTDVLHPRAIRRHEAGVDSFRAGSEQRRVDAVRRKGKYLWLAMGTDALLIHLGMSGQLRIHRPQDVRHHHTRIVFDLDNETQLRFVDQRTFGGMQIVEGGAEDPVPHIALDPFHPDYSEAVAAERLRQRKTGVKRALLDQKLVSGIGNIYADEALWRAKLHYDYPCDRLSQQQAVQLLAETKQVMTAALAAGGTSFDALYVNVNGDSGYFGRDLNVYGRVDRPCHRCGTTIVRRRFTNRSSYLCPRCQPRPRRRR
ncbi:MAG: DNA-formamidopyrimidine glycosylase [Arachnia propionica]|nr:MAG: DNA-formamidopyrimidine glycosylase [Arachnia propionica]